MKFLALLAAFTCVMGISCKKTGTSISGKWHILTDSQYVGVGLGNHVQVYHGNPLDYFDFGPNGHLSVSENGVQSTLAYTVYPNSKIVISSFGITLNGIPDTSRITGLSSHAVEITSSFFPTPGGTFGRMVVLFR
jgi:hypothetical protein